MKLLLTRLVPVPLLLLAAGCDRPVPAPATPVPATSLPATTLPPPGVTANSGGDTRGTVLYQPAPPPPVPANPYIVLSDRFVIGQRQQMATALVQMGTNAHTRAALRCPVPEPGSPRYSKPFASVRAQQQAKLEIQLLEQSHAQFCAQYQVTLDQCELLLREAREKHWLLPPG